jgi:hypothetical protein
VSSTSLQDESRQSSKLRRAAVQRRFFLLIRVGDQPGHSVDQKVDHTPRTRVLKPADGLELLVARLKQRALPEGHRVEARQECVSPGLAKPSEEVHALGLAGLNKRLTPVPAGA